MERPVEIGGQKEVSGDAIRGTRGKKSAYVLQPETRYYEKLDWMALGNMRRNKS